MGNTASAVRIQNGEVAPVRFAERRPMWRAIGVGVALTTAVNVYDPVSDYIIHSSSFTRSHMPFALFLGLLFLVVLVNPLLRWRRPAAVFTPEELAVVLTIGFLGMSVPTMVGRFMGTVSAPEYFASPENEWPTYVLPNLTSWLYPSNEGGAVSQFYQGLAPGRPVPWEAWFTPLFWWFALIVAILFGCFCLAVVLRKQWSERERLAYPLVAMPLMIAQSQEGGRRFPAFMSGKLFWIGFVVPLMMILWNVVGVFVTRFPTFVFLNANNLVSVGRGFPQVFFRFDFYVICFAYFTSVEILFSVWVFCLFGILQEGVCNRIGIPVSVGWQSQAALAFLVVWGLWVARGHLKDVWRKAWRGDADVDDSEEMLSYRTAVGGAAVCGVFILLWMIRAGMEPPLAAVYLISCLILYLGMAKIVSMTGLVALRGSLDANGITKSLINIQNISDTGIAANNMMYALYSGNKGFCMPGAANTVKASEGVRGPGARRLGGWVMTGAVLSLLAGVLTTLYLGYYGNGAENFGSYDFTNGNRHPYNYTVGDLKGRLDAKWPWWGMGYGASGIALMGLLTSLTYRFPWWPLHPVGLAVAYAYPVRASWFSVFIAWLVKFILVRVGGMQIYRRSQGFFLGMAIGYALGVVFGFVMDMLFFMGQGNPLHTPPI